MLVRELIAKLEEFHPDHEVAIVVEGEADPNITAYLASTKEHMGPFVAVDFDDEEGFDNWGPVAKEDDNARASR